MGGGRWAVGGGRWAVGGGRWAVGGGRWAVGGGRERSGIKPNENTGSSQESCRQVLTTTGKKSEEDKKPG